MTYGASQGLSDPLEDYPGYWLKFYEQGVVTPISMATDDTGGTLLAKAEISSGGTVPIGFIKTAGDVIFIPYLAESYDAYLFPTEAEADANDTSNAVPIADNVTPVIILSEEVSANDNVRAFSNVAAMVADVDLVLGQIVSFEAYTSSGGGNSGAVVAAGTGTTDEGEFIDLPNTTPALQFKASFPGDIHNDAQWGVAGSDSTADRIALQAAVDFLSPGDTLNIIVNATIENATGTGATPVIQRADAIASGTLFAITSATNSITINIQSAITGTSLLDDVFRFTGEKVLVKGPGSVVGSGSILDTNSDDPLLNWRPSLVRIEGKGSICNKVKFVKPHTVSLYLAGSELGASQNVFQEGLSVHGSGTVYFGIESGVTGDPDYGNIIVKNMFYTVNGENVYSAIYNTADETTIHANDGDGQLEHAIYSFGSATGITNNIFRDVIGATIQCFGDNRCDVSHNILKNCLAGGIAMTRGTRSIVSNNIVETVANAAISWRRFSSGTTSDNYMDLAISDNILSSEGTQACIDVAIDCNVQGMKVTGNSMTTATSSSSFGSCRIQILDTATAGGRRLTFFDNTVNASTLYAGYFSNWNGFKINDNTFVNPDNASAVRMFNMVNGEFADNTVIDTRGTPVAERIVVAPSGDGNSKIDIRNNTGQNLLVTANPIVTGPDTDGRYRGNNVDYSTAFGTFTAASATTTAVVNLTMRASGGNQVILTPINKAATDVQAGSQAMYVSVLADGSFTAASSDVTSLAGTETYSYEIIQ